MYWSSAERKNSLIHWSYVYNSIGASIEWVLCWEEVIWMGVSWKDRTRRGLCGAYVDKNRQGLLDLGLWRVTTAFFRAGTLLWGNMCFGNVLWATKELLICWSKVESSIGASLEWFRGKSVDENRNSVQRSQGLIEVRLWLEQQIKFGKGAIQLEEP